MVLLAKGKKRLLAKLHFYLLPFPLFFLADICNYRVDFPAVI